MRKRGDEGKEGEVKKKRGINKKTKTEEGNHWNRAIITTHGVNLN